MNRKIILLFGLLLASLGAPAQDRIETGAEQTGRYLPLLEGRRVGIMTNHTGTVGRKNRIWSIRCARWAWTFGSSSRPSTASGGRADAGESVASYRDRKTGIDVVSVYGSTKRPPDSIMQRLDVLLFDVQDVGLRYYTYLSFDALPDGSLRGERQAAERAGPPQSERILCGRPGTRSEAPFVRRHAPDSGLVHGMTLGELARMIDGEGWLRDGLRCKLTVIPCRGYTHRYALPAADGSRSPNLPNMRAVYLYPSLWFSSRARRSAWGRGTEPLSRFRHTDTRSCRAISRLRRARSNAGAKNQRRSKTNSATASICGPPRPTSGYGKGEWTSAT